jgi:histidinol dehydrogenase
MNAVPAQVAGVGEINVVTPPTLHGAPNQLVLATCAILGIENVYAVGGAQAIAAVAYGTQTVPKVDKIVGPGNVFVAAAKKMVFGDVDIDMIAGPSEVVVLADSSADPDEVSSDLLAQAEHDCNAASVLVTTEKSLANKVRYRIQELLQNLSRRQIASESIRRNGAAFVVNNMSEAAELINEIAPEHLEIIVKNGWRILDKIKNSGAIFLGRYSPEPVGDYFAGPSHVLPTGGSARFSSVLSVDTFLKRSSVICYSRKAFERDSKKIQIFAESEGLTAHALSVSIRDRSRRQRSGSKR